MWMCYFLRCLPVSVCSMPAYFKRQIFEGWARKKKIIFCSFILWLSLGICRSTRLWTLYLGVGMSQCKPLALLLDKILNNILTEWSFRLLNDQNKWQFPVLTQEILHIQNLMVWFLVSSNASNIWARKAHTTQSFSTDITLLASLIKHS